MTNQVKHDHWVDNLVLRSAPLCLAVAVVVSIFSAGCTRPLSLGMFANPTFPGVGGETEDGADFARSRGRAGSRFVGGSGQSTSPQSLEESEQAIDLNRSSTESSARSIPGNHLISRKTSDVPSESSPADRPSLESQSLSHESLAKTKDPLGIIPGSENYIKKRKRKAEARRKEAEDRLAKESMDAAIPDSVEKNRSYMASDYANGKTLEESLRAEDQQSMDNSNPLRNQRNHIAQNSAKPEIAPTPPNTAGSAASVPQNQLAANQNATDPGNVNAQLIQQLQLIQNQLRRNSPEANRAVLTEFIQALNSTGQQSPDVNLQLANQISQLANTNRLSNSSQLGNGLFGSTSPRMNQFEAALQNVTAQYSANNQLPANNAGALAVQPASYNTNVPNQSNAQVQRAVQNSPHLSNNSASASQMGMGQGEVMNAGAMENGNYPASNWKQSLVQTIESIRQKLGGELNSSERLQLETNLRLLYLIANQQEAAMQSIESLPPELKGYWTSQIFSLAQIMQSELDDSSATFVNHRIKANRALPELNKAVENLANVARLKVANPQFTQSVTSFGKYEVADSLSFAAGERIVVYAELENYFVKKTSGVRGNFYETVIQPSWVILDENGQMVDEYHYKKIVDTCRSRRSDFHITLSMNFPRLKKGRYKLVVSVQDIHGNKEGSSPPLEFSIR